MCVGDGAWLLHGHPVGGRGVRWQLADRSIQEALTVTRDRAIKFGAADDGVTGNNDSPEWSAATRDMQGDRQ